MSFVNDNVSEWDMKENCLKILHEDFKGGYKNVKSHQFTFLGKSTLVSYVCVVPLIIPYFLSTFRPFHIIIKYRI